MLAKWHQLRSALFGPALELWSPLTPDECLDRLRQNTDPFWKLFGSKPVVGRVSRGTFAGYKRIFYGNSFRTFVFANMNPGSKGTVLTLRFGMSRYTTAFMMFWFAGVLVIGGAMTVLAAKAYLTSSAQEGEWLFLVIPPLMIAGGAAIVASGRWLGRNERPFLIAFMRTTLSAS